MTEYSFFIDSESLIIGVAIDDENTLSICEYNALQDKGKPKLIELIQLLLNSYPETIDDFRERLVLIDDPAWDVREQLIFIRGDGGEDIINHSFKSDRAGVEMNTELLPGISYKQLFDNTVNYHPKNTETAQKEVETEASFVVTTPGIFSMQTILVRMKLHPVLSVMLIIAFFTLVIGGYRFQSTPDTIILAPDRLQQAALVDQQLNELKVSVDDLWHDLKGQMLLPNKEKKLYWQKFKPLNLQYHELRRSGFGHGNKFNAVNDTLKKIKDRIRPKKKTKNTKTKNIKNPKQIKKQAPPPKTAPIALH